MKVVLRDEARDDLVNAASFYGDQSTGLDEYFLECLTEDIRKLEATGGIHERYRGFYRALSDRFPYAIYYLLTEGVVEIVAVLDFRRNPLSLRIRLGQTNR